MNVSHQNSLFFNRRKFPTLKINMFINIILQTCFFNYIFTKLECYRKTQFIGLILFKNHKENYFNNVLKMGQDKNPHYYI